MIFSLPALAILSLVAAYAVAKIARSLTVPLALGGLGLVFYFMQGMLNGMVVNVGTRNATLDVSVDAAEFQLMKSRLADFEKKLFGESAGKAGQHLTSLAALLQDMHAVEGKVLEVKSVLQAFSNNSKAAETFLRNQAKRMEAMVIRAVGHGVELLSSRDFWVKLAPLLQEVGLHQDVSPDVLLRVEAEKARVQEELRIRSNIPEKVERVRAEGWRHLARSMSEDFNDHLPFRAAVLVAVFAAFFALRLLYHLLLQRLRVPPLVDETSWDSWDLGRWRCCRRRQPKGDVQDWLFRMCRPAVILDEAVQESIEDMACIALQAGSAGHSIALPHAIFFGPPGTGKSLTARRLAIACGLDYAVMAGGNVLGLREDAVPELRKLFLWAQRSWRGLVLFVDEAEAFLSARGDGSNHFVQAAISFFLAQTSTSSPKMMIILATNRIQDLDSAMCSRMAFKIEFGKPSKDSVQKMIDDRLRALDAEAEQTLRRVLEENPQHFHELGFSGRDVQALFEEFSRRWSLYLATSGKKKVDGDWLSRWLRQRGGRCGVD